MSDSETTGPELQQAIETYRALYGLMDKIGTLLIVADAAVIWGAIMKPLWQCWYIWLLGAALPLGAFVVALRAAHLMKPIAYTAVSLEQRSRCGANHARHDGLASMFLATTYGRSYAEHLERIASQPEIASRRDSLYQLPPPYTFGTFAHTSTGAALLGMSLSQWFLALGTLFFFGPQLHSASTCPEAWSCPPEWAVALGALWVLLSWLALAFVWLQSGTFVKSRRYSILFVLSVLAVVIFLTTLFSFGPWLRLVWTCWQKLAVSLWLISTVAVALAIWWKRAKARAKTSS